MNKLLTRDDFRNSVFERDNHTCVFCDKPAVDAHHILERRLWGESSGYYLNNGASVCGEDHLMCEMTTISVEEVREACGIEKPIIPPHLYNDQIYDKWGNIILPNKQRLKGELFFNESVQKILRRGQVLDLFTSYVKYARTYHLPWSQGMTNDDRMMPNINAFKDQRVIVTEKMDGENSTIYNNYFHARSIDSINHESRNWIKNFISCFNFNLPNDWRLCGENMYAEHSIHYDELESYFYGFSIWNDKNECLSWDETLEWFAILHPDIKHVPILYDGIFDKALIVDLWNKSMYNNCEGYVVRVADSFPMSLFRLKVGKFVRENHVNTDDHWRFGKRMIINNLKEDDLL